MRSPSSKRLRTLTLSIAVAGSTLAALATDLAHAGEPVATFSIVGYDAETGDLGIAVQSKFFAVGAVVPWARAGAGAIATQAFANTTFGPRGLDLLAGGLSAEAVVDSLIESDAGRAARQLGVVGADGSAAAYTGDECMSWAGHEVGEGFTAQGNILFGPDVVAEMARAYRESDGVLGEKLMSALEAGQQAGGDSRGMQSAAILVVRENGGYAGFDDRYCDLRVDDHPDPIAELRRIFDMWKWNALVNEGYVLTEDERWDEAFDVAERLIATAPDEGESYYHPACFYSKAGHVERALELLEQAIERDGSLRYRASQDPDFESLWSDPRFGELTFVPPSHE
jgi:uncharacterized Ntn-hydrolase superfamily protein